MGAPEGGPGKEFLGDWLLHVWGQAGPYSWSTKGLSELDLEVLT